MWSLCFNVDLFPFKNRNWNWSQRYCRLLSSSCYGFPRSCVLFFRGQHRFCYVLVSTIHDSNPRSGLVLKTEKEFELRYCIDHRDRKLLCLRLGRFSYSWESILSSHESSFSFRGIVYSRHRCFICCPSSVSRVWKYCPVSTSFKPASEHNLDNFWSFDNGSNFRVYSCTKFLRCSALVWVSSVEGPVGISIFSKWSGAAGLSRSPNIFGYFVA